MVTSYEVMWTSGECPGGVLSGSDNINITSSSVSHTITGLRGDTTYTMIVTAYNSAGNNSIKSVTRDTTEHGE